MNCLMIRKKSIFTCCRATAVACMALVNTGCSGFLDAKPDKKLVIPSQLVHLEALMDDYFVVNGSDPTLLEASADNLYLTADTYALLSQDQQRQYTWQPDFLFSEFPNDWSIAWDAVFIANTVLDNLPNIPVTNENLTHWQSVKGQALLHRARLFAAIASVWCMAYDEASADTDLGIPLRLDSDFNKTSVRSSLRQTHDQIIEDLKASAALLPEAQITAFRPVKAAAYGLLARIYLAMRRYPEASLYADSTLALHSGLLDFNGIDTNAVRPISRANEEVVFETFAGNNALVDYSRAAIVPELYAMYAHDDLRRAVYFVARSDGSKGFRANHTGESGLFTGIATDELYLIRAECRTRAGDLSGGLADLNTLLASRWRQGTFNPVVVSTPTQALAVILTERRKEMVYRGSRWMDIKRLNKEGYGISLSRTADGSVHVLQPGDLRFALALPEEVIKLSGMKQNPR